MLKAVLPLKVFVLSMWWGVSELTSIAMASKALATEATEATKSRQMCIVGAQTLPTIQLVSGRLCTL